MHSTPMHFAYLLMLGLVACRSTTTEPTPVPTVPIAEASPAPDAAPPPPREDPRWQAKIDRVIEQVSALRKLPKKKPVPGVVLERKALLDEIKAHVRREVPKEAIEREALSMKLCGLIDKDVDYEGITFRLLEEQLAGFYLPEGGKMYLAGDLDEEMAQATLVHELVHALQDQHFDLNTKYQPGQGDRAFARSAMAEGDATSAMTDSMTGESEPNAQVEKIILATMQASMPDYAPKIMQRGLVAPYVRGLAFVNALRRKGGWDAVDAAWRAMPVTSEQILHVDKYLAKEPAIPIAAPAADTFGPGFVRDDDDSLGEEGLLLMIEELTGQHHLAADLARGWGGDRNAIFSKPEGIVAVAMHLRYDPDRKATAPKLASALASALGSKLTTSGGISAFCKERPELGPMAVVARASGDVAMVFGPADTKSWKSAGTCTEATKIARATLDR